MIQDMKPTSMHKPYKSSNDVDQPNRNKKLSKNHYLDIPCATTSQVANEPQSRRIVLPAHPGTIDTGYLYPSESLKLDYALSQALQPFKRGSLSPTYLY